MANKHYKGFKPLSYQRAVINELCTPDSIGKGKVVVCKSQRQRGKSIMDSNILLWYAINIKKSKNFYIAPTIKQSKEIYKQIESAIEGSGIIKSSNATDLIIKLINGSTINFKSGIQKENLRGFTCTGILVIDEAAYLTDDVLNIILPWTDFHKANILMTSTPFVKTGFFWKYYNYGLTNTHNTVTIDWCDDKFKEDMLKVMSAERLKEYEATLPKNVFRMDYMGLFLDDEGSVFTEFKKCVLNSNITPLDKLYVGIDWAAGNENDDTAISIINQNGKQVYLEYFNNLTPTQQIDRIEHILLKYLKQIVVVQTELNSLGTPLTDFLKEKPQLSTLKDKFIGFNTTNQSKNAIVQNLQIAFENNEINILDDAKQLNELATYTAEYNPKTRNVYYNAPQGLNDDICIALMLSYDAYKNGNVVGNYNISITKHTFGKNNNRNKGISYIGQ